MAILTTDRDVQMQLSCYDAMLRIQNGLNAHHGKPPTIDFGADAVVLRSSSPIQLDCRGVTWVVEARESEHEVSAQHYAAIELPPSRRTHEAAALVLMERFRAEVVLGPVPILRKRGTLHASKPFVELPSPPPAPPAPRARMFRADLVRQLQKLQRERMAIEDENQQLADALTASKRALSDAKAAYLEDPTSKSGNAVTKAESDMRLALFRQQAKQRPVPADKLSSIERLRAILARIDNSRPCYLTGQDAGGIPDGGTLTGLNELAACFTRPAPGGQWHWRSRRPGPLGGDAGPRNPAGRAPATRDGDGGHCCFSYDVAGVDDQRELFDLLVARSVAYRIDGGWRVIAALSRPCTDDELAAVVAALELGTEAYSTWGAFPPAGTTLLNLDNVPPVDVDQVLAGGSGEA